MSGPCHAAHHAATKREEQYREHLKALETCMSLKKHTFSLKRLISTAGCLTVTVPERFLMPPLYCGGFHLKSRVEPQLVSVVCPP